MRPVARRLSRWCSLGALLTLWGCDSRDTVAVFATGPRSTPSSEAGSSAAVEAGVAFPPSSRDAGEQDAPNALSPDAARAAEGSVCSALYCSGFEDESSVLIQGSQTPTQNAGSLEQDCQVAFQGQCALRATIEEPGGTAYLAIQVPSREAMFLRAYLWVPEDWVLNDAAILHVGEPGGSGGVNVDLRDNERFELFLVADGDARYSAAGTVRRQVWLCLQLGITAEGVVSLGIDEQVVAQAQSPGLLPSAGQTMLTLGVDWSSANQAPGSLWFDEVVFDDEPVLCL